MSCKIHQKYHQLCCNVSEKNRFETTWYSDSDWAGSAYDMKRTSRYYFILGSRMFLWFSKKKDIVVQSTAKAEFVVATAATVNHALWLRKFFGDLHMNQTKGTKVFVHKRSTIAISQNLVFHEKEKHFNIKIYFLREVQNNGDVILLYFKI